MLLRALVLVSLTMFELALKGQSAAPEEVLKDAVTHHQKGDFEEAIRLYKSYLESVPESLIALSNLGAAYAHEGRYDDAISEYSKALTLQPGNVPVELNLALAYYKTGRVERAAPILEKIYRSDPSQLQPALLLADCWLAMGKNQEVAGLLTPLAEKHPDDLGVAYALGTALVRDNQIARGQVVINRILRNGDSAEARLLMGTTKLNVLDFAGALADLTRAVELNPRLPDVYSFYGQALMRTGDAAGAARAFREELKLNPNDFNA